MEYSTLTKNNNFTMRVKSINIADKKKFAVIYNDLYKPIIRYIYYRVSDIDLAEEITQETFLKTWIYINSSNKEILDIKNFLYKVAKNLIIDSYKQKNKTILYIEELSLSEIKEKPKLNELIDRKTQYELLIKLIHKIDKKYKKILLYRFLDDMSIDDICDRTGMSPNYVSVMIYKGLKILKENFKKITTLNKYKQKLI